jgi:hypothetical protein
MPASTQSTVFLVPCTACDSRVPGDATYFSASGEVCSACHAAEAAADSAEFAAGTEPDTPMGRPGIRLGALVLHRGGVSFDLSALFAGIARLFTSFAR